MPLAPELESALVVWQCLVALQFSVDLVNRIAELACIHLGEDISQCAFNSCANRIGAGHRTAEPLAQELKAHLLPELRLGGHLQSIQASHPRPKHHCGGFHHNNSGYARFQSPVGKVGDEFRRKCEHFLRVCDQPLENGLGFPFLETDPLQFGHFFNEPLHFLVVFHATADALAPGFGNTVLMIFSVVALNQI